jgi:hypothetical protein
LGTDLSGVVLELLNVELLGAVLGVVSSVPVDLLDGVGAVSIDGEPGLATVSEEALLVDTESGGVTALRNGTGVGDGHAEGSNRVLNDIEVLESGGDTVLGGE